MLTTDEWAVNGKKTFVFLMMSLVISLLVTLLLAIGFIANICTRGFSSHQLGLYLPIQLWHTVYHLIYISSIYQSHIMIVNEDDDDKLILSNLIY